MEVLARVLSLGRFCGEGLTQKLSSFSNVFFFLFFFLSRDRVCNF